MKFVVLKTCHTYWLHQPISLEIKEFLWAMDDAVTFPAIRKSYGNRAPMGENIHDIALQRFREYLMVGGMPQAVDEYRRTRNFGDVDRVK